MNIKETFNKRRLKYGSFATALTVFVIAAIVLLNIVATMLFDRFPITLDLTSGSIYTVSDETAEYIETVETPVEITVLDTEDEYRSISDYTSQTAELLKNYTQHNSGITVKYIDMLSNPDFVANYTQTLSAGDIIVEPAGGAHERVKVVSLTDIISVPDDYVSYLSGAEQAYGAEYAHSMFVAGEQSRQVELKSNAEQAITSAIMTVTDSDPITVAVLSYPGANEADVSGLTDLLDVNGYLITNIDIQSGELTDDVDLAIIPAPKVDYTTAEITKLENWLQGGGMLEKDLIYVASAQQPATPNIDGLLYKYGVTVEPKIIYETDTSRWMGQDTPSYTLQDIVTENYLEDVTNLNRSFFVPDARALTLRFENVDSTYACEPIIASSQSAELRDMYRTETETSERGSFTSVAVAKQERINQDTHISTYTYVVVFGSELILDPTVIKNPGFNNGDLIISMLNELTGKSEGITIKPKAVASDTFEITTAQTRTLTLVFALIIPVVVLALGTFVWIRRRHK